MAVGMTDKLNTIIQKSQSISFLFMKILSTAFLYLYVSFSVYAQAYDEIERSFQTYAYKFSVPVDIIKAVAYTETRFFHQIPDENHKACSGIPHSYGIMGLRNDNWFGYSLLLASNLIQASHDSLITNFDLNIKGASALLSFLAEEKKINRVNINEWKSVLENYSGIPQTDVQKFYSFDVFKVLSEGTMTNGIEILPHPEVDMSIFGEDVNPQNKLKNLESDDYGPAVWDPSPNYTANSINRLFAVVHDTEGSFSGALSWLKNPVSNASSHYIIRSSDGYIVQLVREHNKAWHVSCWNSYMLGVEHEGFVNNPAYYTEAMYQSSAALFKHFVTKFGIPIDRNRIIAHQEWQNQNWKNWMTVSYPAIGLTCNTHTDPGTYWRWDYFMSLINSLNKDIINGFEYVVSPWWDPNTSGSTYGISKNSTFTQSSESKMSGTYGAKTILIDSSQSSNWFVRVFYNYSSNDTLKLGTTGYIRVYLKASSIPTGLKIRLAVDDNSNSITESSTWKSVIADGSWHLYEWRMDDPGQWDSWVGGGNGQIDGPNTYFDSFQFSCNDPNSGSSQFVIYMDNLEKGTEPLNIISVNLTAFLEGLYNITTNYMIRDTLSVLLKSTNSPFMTVDSAKIFLDSLGNATAKFLTASSGSFYLVLKHRNHLETWSRSGGENFSKGISYSYNFTDNSSKAFGNNLKLKGTKWCIFAGDVNGDGIVDLGDLSLTENDNINFTTGYVTTDSNGDGIVDLVDLSLVATNSFSYVSKITP